MRLRTSLIAAIFLATAAAPSWSATFYVAPRTAPVSAVTPDGSQSKPWKTVNQALSKAKAGDTILLMDGQHWGLRVKDLAFDTPVTVRSQNGKNARFSWIAIGGSSRNIVFKDLSLWPNDPATATASSLIETGVNTKDIVFDGIDGRSGADADTYPSWSGSKWGGRTMKGVQARGVRTTVKNSTFTGVSYGVISMGADTQILNNRIAGFSYDGMRIFGKNTVVRGNTITDCVRIDGNHPDAIQSWSLNGVPVQGLVFDGNTILEWSAAAASPLRCRLQGIGFFDGYYDDLQITNNVIATTAYHGISIYGGRNVALVNNTVVNISGAATTYPWIGIFNHKNGKPSQDILSSNNLAMKYSMATGTLNKTVTNNSVVIYPARVLSDVAAFDYRPKADSGFINTGDATTAPKVDRLNHMRPYAGGPDRGAYEVGSTSGPVSDLSYLLGVTAGARLAASQ